MTTRSRALSPLFGLVLLASPLAAAPQLQGGLIGDPTGRSGLWPRIEAPLGNPFESQPPNDFVPTPGSYTEAKARLGKALFWDEQVSTDNTMACATCHLPEMSGIDPRLPGVAQNNGHGSRGMLPQDAADDYIAGTKTAQQERVTEVIAPTMLGSGFLQLLFWDLRAGPGFTFADGSPILDPNGVDQFGQFAALEDLAVDPPVSSTEMAHDSLAWDSGVLEAKLGKARMLALATFSTVPADLQPLVAAGVRYAEHFDAVFADDPNFGAAAGYSGVTRERFALAVATYLRTLVPNQAPIDTRALTDVELAGFQHLKASGAPNVKCLSCHATHLSATLTGTGGFVNAMDAMLTDGHLRGGQNFPSPVGATGRAVGSISVKTPTLRNLTLKPIFAHNGFFDDLANLIDFYNRGGPTVPSIFFNSGSGPGGRLTPTEVGEVLAFFEALVDPRLVPAFPGAPLPPPFDHPDLHSQRVPFQSNEPSTHPGTPPPGGGPVPDIIVNAPALTADAHWKIGVRDAPGSATAVLGLSPDPLLPPGSGWYLTGPGQQLFVTSTDPKGFATVHLPPLPSSLGGTTFRAQWRVFADDTTRPALSNPGEVLVHW